LSKQMVCQQFEIKWASACTRLSLLLVKIKRPGIKGRELATEFETK